MEVVLGIGLGLVVVWAVLVAVLWALRPRDVPLRELVRVIPDVLRLVRSLIADPAVPGVVRFALGVLLVWLVSPIELIPELIPVLGPLDDAVVAVVILRFVRRRLGAAALRDRWPGTPAGWELVARLIGA